MESRVVPIGPPGVDARTASWNRYVRPAASPQIDLAALAEASEPFSPADIEFAARKASQRALEFAVQAAWQPAPEESALATEAYLEAIEGSRATVTEPVVRDFYSIRRP